MKIRFAFVLFSLAGVIALAALPGYARQSTEVLTTNFEKVALWVIEHTADGAQAEFLVVLANQADLSGARALPTRQEKGRYVREALWETAQSTQAPLLRWLASRGVEHRAYYIVNLVWVKGDRDLALTLAARQDVARLEGNPQVRISDLGSRISDLGSPISNLQSFGYAQDKPPISNPSATLRTSLQSIEPNIAYVRAPEVWTMGFTGQGIVIGGQDTGYAWAHTALKQSYRGWDGTEVSHDYNWHDAIHSNSHGVNLCGIDSPVPCDDHGHGTHTMGTAVGDDGAGNQIGMAPGSEWIGCRNMDNGWGTPATYLECFEFFLAPYPMNGTPAQGDPAKAPDVTLNSWSCPLREGCAWDTLQRAVEAQHAAGIMTVVSAGNSGPNCSTVNEPPALYATAYSAGALNTGTDTIALLSSRGPVTIDGSYRRKPDIVAPGTDVRSSVPGGYNQKTGTSMAGPHVAGAVALLWSARPALKNQITATQQVLNEFAVHIPSSNCSDVGWPNNTYGYGRLDVKAAVDMAGTLTGVVHSKDTGAPLSAVVQASGAFSTTRITTGAASGQYTLTLPAGIYTLTATYNGYGYCPARVTGLQVFSKTTTTQDFTLTPYEHFVVSGVLSDAVSGEPLGGTVTFTGPITVPPAGADPPTGFYRATVMSGTYTLYARAPAYIPVSHTINVHNDQTQNFTLWPGEPPQAGFEVSSPARTGQALLFTNTTTGTLPISFLWTFSERTPGAGDGVTSTLENPTHMYTVPRVYTVTLDATNEYGPGGRLASDRYTRTLTVTCGSPITGVGFAWVPQPALAGRVVTFTASVSGGVAPFTHEWSLSERTPGAKADSLLLPGERVATYTFAQEGTYTVTLRASDACSALSIARRVEVRPIHFVYLPVALKRFAGGSPYYVGQVSTPEGVLRIPASQSSYGKPPHREASRDEGESVVRVHFTQDDLAELAGWLDIWEVNHQAGYLLAMVTPAERDELIAHGYLIQPNLEKTRLLRQPHVALPGQTAGIPGYPCYRTLEETFASAESTAAAHPTLTTWNDVGDSWERTNRPASGYDMRVLRLTNSAIPGPKPKLFVMSSIHAREYAPAELNTRFAEYLVNNYGADPDITWLLDYGEIHLMLQANPDGRKKAEAGILWRKNTNNNFCTDTNQRGVDLNRNFEFEWNCCGGSSGDPCNELYRGPNPASEPETQAIQAYLRSQFPDQREAPLTARVPFTATGIFLDIHSYSKLVLWPWGFGETPAPNETALQTLGRKFAYFNRYTPQQATELYPTDGATMDFAYGELGLAAFTFEVGTTFFQDCSSFENTILPPNLPALVYAAKVARAPYVTPAGPDVLTVTVSPLISSGDSLVGLPVRLTAIADDTRYFSPSQEEEPSQAIVAAEYTINTPPWVDGAVAHPLAAADGDLDSSIEGLVGIIGAEHFSTGHQSSAAVGRHILYVRARDADGNWGPVSAAFLDVTAIPDAGLTGTVRDSTTGQPLSATLQVTGPIPYASTTFFTGPGGTYALKVFSGTHIITATAYPQDAVRSYRPGTVTVRAVSGVTLTRDIWLRRLQRVYLPLVLELE